jgi:hypothetical protein
VLGVSSTVFAELLLPPPATVEPFAVEEVATTVDALAFTMLAATFIRLPLPAAVDDISSLLGQIMDMRQLHPSTWAGRDCVVVHIVPNTLLSPAPVVDGAFASLLVLGDAMVINTISLSFNLLMEK